MSEEDKTGEEYLIELAAYIATSAKGCMEEPKSYGTFRLIDTLGRVLELPDHIPGFKKDLFLQKIREDVEKNKLSKMSNPQAFNQFIDTLILDLAKEVKRRNLSK